MPGSLSLAVLHGDPPQVIIAQDLETLQWRLALDIVARTPASELAVEDATQIRADLLEERWGSAVGRWVSVTSAVLDVFESWDLYLPSDVALAPAELQFTPLFRDSTA